MEWSFAVSSIWHVRCSNRMTGWMNEWINGWMECPSGTEGVWRGWDKISALDFGLSLACIHFYLFLLPCLLKKSEAWKYHLMMSWNRSFRGWLAFSFPWLAAPVASWLRLIKRKERIQIEWINSTQIQLRYVYPAKEYSAYNTLIDWYLWYATLHTEKRSSDLFFLSSLRSHQRRVTIPIRGRAMVVLGCQRWTKR